MKVALISDCYPPRVGGIESQVRDLARRLVDAGHDVEVLTATNGTDGSTQGAREVVDGITVHRLGTRVPFGLPVNPGGRDLLRDRLQAGGFDVAHAHVGVISPFAVDGGDVALELGIPLTVTWHCVLGAWEPVVRRLGHAERWAEAGAALHGVSEMAAEQVRSLAPGATVTVLHNGIDAGAWRTDDGEPTSERRPPHTGRPGGTEPTVAAPDAADEMVLEEQPLRVVLAMRFTPRKRPLSVIGIVRRARGRAAVPITLEICGGGPLLAPVRAAVRRRGWSDWVSLPGRIDRASLVAHYRAADVYLASSRFESFGIAALEGRTVGLPVVALRGSGAEDFVSDGITGLVRDGDEGLVDGLVELAHDRALLARLRAHNERVPPAQDWSRIVRDVEQEYARARRLLAGGTEGRHTETVNHWLVRVEAVDGVGRTVVTVRLEHGADPVQVLAKQGWDVVGGVEVRQEDLTVVIVLRVEPLDVLRGAAEPTAAADRPVEDGLTPAEIAAATPYQRVAVYALVESEHGLLLTELSDRTWRPGEWTLPGGGIDPGESALAALHREVWEETDQVIDEVEFLGVLSNHWIGRAPGGRVEDFHAVRLYYRGRCRHPSAPVVHDTDGSTASAAWVPRTRLEAVPVASSLAPALAQWLD
ncbi:glycosyltransferase [Nostocoides sp. F2B08]|uniref:glycosyltransferase n=1 Tax=Nostocoides sp. F2B08 TaxID=2653936 RepID=UPI001D03F27E|nr:glycosyltransferase [Tetrasphaera sp. F2B08]